MQLTKRYPQGLLEAVNIPWTERYELDEPTFARHVEHAIAMGHRYIYVLGTAGEGHALTDAQYKRVVDLFLDKANRPEVDPQVCVITLSAGHMIERIGYAFDKGARMFQIVLPSWGMMSSDEKLDFFRLVCGEYPDARFLHYNYPMGTNTMSPTEYRMAVDAVPNLVATKISVTDMKLIGAYMTEAPELQHFFLEHPYPYGCLYGECSLISSFGTLFPELSKRLFDAGRNGDLAAAFAIQRRMAELASGLFRTVEGPHMAGAFDKLLAWLADRDFPRRLLPPYQPLTEEVARAAREYYDKHCDDLS